MVGTREWQAAGLAPVQPDCHVCVSGVYYVPDGPSWHEGSWAGQFVLAYMRLVRADAVRAQRRRSALWREAQAERHRRDSNVGAAGEHAARAAAGQALYIGYANIQAVPANILKIAMHYFINEYRMSCKNNCIYIKYNK